MYKRPIVYLDGSYWGIHNLRERIDRHHLASHHSVAPDEVDLLQNGIRAGDMEHWKRLEQLFNGPSEKPAEWMPVLEPFIDLDNLFDYVTAEVFLDNRDWPLNNEQQWRPARRAAVGSGFRMTWTVSSARADGDRGSIRCTGKSCTSRSSNHHYSSP